ncbi:MAG TPA: hypothetical protein VE843_10595 [Ktedonobacteraceae bacterium]|nr:hypothetical protein [Ktedonobacteraceae bacterium]
MTKRTIGIFFIISILMDLIGLGLLAGGLVGSTYTTTNNGYSTSAQVATFGNLPLFITGVILLSLSAIPFLIAWIGALVNLARLQEWIWFVFMIIFSWITLLVYLIAGPTRPRVQQYAQYMPPQQPQYNPQQPYYNTQQPQSYPQQQQYNPQQAQNYPQEPQYNPQQSQDYLQHPQSYPQQSPYNPEQPQNNPQPPQDYPQS